MRRKPTTSEKVLIKNSLLKAVKYFGSQKKLAEKLRISQQTLNYMINHKMTIPYQHAIIIDKITDGEVKKEHLVPHEKYLNSIVNIDYKLSGKL